MSLRKTTKNFASNGVKTLLNLEITVEKGKLPRLPFLKLKNKILGKKYNLSIVFTDNKTTKKLNRIYRKKNKPANVLSFPLSKNKGEIFLSIKEAEKSKKLFNKKGAELIGFFLIHAMLHLKGLAHGSTMEHMEEKFSRYFGI